MRAGWPHPVGLPLPHGRLGHAERTGYVGLIQADGLAEIGEPTGTLEPDDPLSSQCLVHTVRIVDQPSTDVGCGRQIDARSCVIYAPPTERRERGQWRESASEGRSAPRTSSWIF